MEITVRTIIIIIVIILFVFLLYPHLEGFDQTSTVFVPVGYQRYGLRGDKIKSSDIAKNFISPHRNIAIDPTSGEMWQSNNAPCTEGINGCKKVVCPTNNDEYDNLDTCWECGKWDYYKQTIPPMHPHVPI
jgi:hypothetical protein